MDAMKLISVFFFVLIIISGCKKDPGSTSPAKKLKEPDLKAPNSENSKKIDTGAKRESGQEKSDGGDTGSGPSKKSPDQSDTIDRLISSLDNNDAAARLDVIKKLGKTGSEMAIAPLAKCLRNGSKYERIYAAESLGHIKNIEATDRLLDALNDRIALVRGASLVALARIGDNKAVESMINALNDEDMKVRLIAEESLSIITKKQLKGHANWKQWYESEWKPKHGEEK